LQLIHIDSEVLLKTGDFFPENVTEPLTNKLVKKRKRDRNKNTWKDKQKGLEDSWEEITKALKELTARF
jgi:hypothetical protein